MKKSSFVAALVAVIVMFASCGGGSKYTTAIPDNSMLLAKINVGNVVNESQILEQPILKMAIDFAKAGMPQEAQALLSEILENPSNSGLDVSQPVLLAMSMEPVSVVASLPVCDASAIAETVENFMGGSNVQIVSRNGLSYIDFGTDDVEVAYNDEMMVVAVNEKGAADAAYYMNLDADNQAVNNKKYKEFFAAGGDASIYMDYSCLFECMKQMPSVAQMGGAYDFMSEMAVMTNLDFADGYVGFFGRLFPSAEYLKLLKGAILDVDRKFFGYIPSNAILVANYACDWEKCLALYPEEMGVQQALEEAGITNEMISALKGEMTVAVTATTAEGGYAEFFVAADCSDKAVFDCLMGFLSQAGLQPEAVAEDVYTVGFGAGSRYYLVYKENAVLLMPQTIYDEVVSGDKLMALANNIKDNVAFDALKKPGMVIDVVAISNILNELSLAEFLGKEAAMVMDVLGMVDNVEIIADDATSGQMKINLKNKDTNALKQIVDCVFNLAAASAMGL